MSALKLFLPPILTSTLLISKIIRNIFYYILFIEAINQFKETTEKGIPLGFESIEYNVGYTYSNGQKNINGPYCASVYKYNPKSQEESFWIINNRKVIKNDYKIYNDGFENYNFDYFITNDEDDFITIFDRKNLIKTAEGFIGIEVFFGIIVGIIIEIITWILITKNFSNIKSDYNSNIEYSNLTTQDKILNFFALSPLSIFFTLMKIALFSSFYKEVMEFMINFRETIYINYASYLNKHFEQEIEVQYTIFSGQSWFLNSFNPEVSYLVFMIMFYGLIENIFKKTEVRFFKCWKGGSLIAWWAIWLILTFPLFKYLSRATENISLNKLISYPFTFIGEMGDLSLNINGINSVIGWGVLNEILTMTIILIVDLINIISKFQHNILRMRENNIDHTFSQPKLTQQLGISIRI